MLHATPQPPQLPSPAAVSQPSSADGSGGAAQLLKPTLQVESHLPLLHEMLMTLVELHARVQEPQKSGLVCRLTSQPSADAPLQLP